MVPLKPGKKGTIAEAYVVYRALLAGLTVSVPLGDNEPYDLEVNHETWQVKCASREKYKRSCYNRKYGPYRCFTRKSNKSTYKPRDFDRLAAVCLETETVWLVPKKLIKKSTTPLHNQFVWPKGSKKFPG